MAKAKMTKNTFMIVNRRSGKALQITGLENGLVVEQNEINYNSAQLWTAVSAGAGHKLVNEANGLVLDLMHNGTENGTWVHTWEDVDGESQLWLIETASRGYRKITNLMANKVLDVYEISEFDGAAAQIWEDMGGENQEWKIVEYPGVTKEPEKKADAPKAAKTTAKKTTKKAAK